MKKHITIIVLLLLTVLMLENVNLHKYEKLPMSKPTEVEYFMDKIASIETPGGGYATVNAYGMMGRYQFSPQTVKAVGIKTTRQRFLQDKNLQDTAMIRLMKLNEKELINFIKKYEGKMFKGIKITRAGVIAGAHFAGPVGVRQFFSNADSEGTVDANGTTLKRYMKYFSNFHLPPVNAATL